jgi:hypothetical protein
MEGTKKGPGKQLFQKGHKLGNRFSKDNQPTIRTKRESLLTKVLRSGCSETELIEIMKVQVNNALNGDLNSAKFVYEYMIGKTQLMSINDSESDSGTLIQQNITNVFNSPQTVSNESLLSMLNNTIETIEISENNGE